MSFYTEQELLGLGLAHVGRGVKLSRLASLHGASRISIGDFSRIDDFCVLSAGTGGIEIGKRVHIATMCSLIGAAKISMADFSTISGRVCVYSSSDDYSGAHMTNPTVPDQFKAVDSRPVALGRHCIVGAGSVILPGVMMEDGVALGSLSLAKGRFEAFMVYAGVPAIKIKARKRDLLRMELAAGAEPESPG